MLQSVRKFVFQFRDELAKAHGLTITQAWTTHNALRTQIELENQIAKGLKLDTTTTLHPEKNTKSVLLGAAYKQPGLHARAVLDIFKVRVIPPSWFPLYLPFLSPMLTLFPEGPYIYRRHRSWS